MHTILFMRHAKSSWKNLALRDFDRPLNKRGKNDVPMMGKRLDARGYRADSIISSPAMRAISTAKGLAKEIGYKTRIIEEKQLYMAEVEDYLQVINSLDEKEKAVMIVSHNPGTEEIIEYLASQDFFIPTAAYVLLEFKGKWKEIGQGSCKVLDYDFPKSERAR